MASWVSWLAPALIGVSVVLLGRAHYVLYVLKRGTRTTTLITWVATLLVAGFWAWKLFTAPDGLVLTNILGLI